MAEYSQKTQELLDRMNTVASRKEYVFDKKKITELVEKSYKLFDLPIPKIKWCVDISDNNFVAAAREAREAWEAWEAATDYDGQEFIFSFELAQTNKINENDKKFNEAQELFLQLKEAGAGYWSEQDGIVYICPNSIIYLEDNQYHSDQKPAISWKDGLELYYLDGVRLSKELWNKILSQKMTFKEIMAIEISDQRTVALKYNPEAIIKENSKLIHKDNRNNELYCIEGKEINTKLDFPKIWFLKMLCPTGRTFIEGVPPEEAEKSPNATDMQAFLCDLTLEEYLTMKLES